MDEEKKISSGTAAILVYSKSLKDSWDSAFYKWLKDEGFESWHCHGIYYNCNWVYVNLNSKIYAPGMLGIPITPVLGNHAVTIGLDLLYFIRNF